MAEDRTLATELESREVAEQAREQEWGKSSFARALFEGRLDLESFRRARSPQLNSQPMILCGVIELDPRVEPIHAFH